MNIVDACEDPAIFGCWFKDRESWSAWFAFLRVLFDLPLSDDDAAVYRACTGRETPPDGPSTEAWLICGRRAGKSFVLATIAVFLATFRDWRPFLGPGERATIMIIACDRRQARTIMRYVKGLLRATPMLKQQIEGETAESIDLRRNVTIEINSASFRSVRGYTLAACLLDEVAFWRSDDSAAPDREIISALRPGMATIPGAMMLCASTAYGRSGALWSAHRRYHGKDGPVLVWQAATRIMNPSVPQSIIDRAMEEDPAAAAAEYGAVFRSDIEALLSREAIDACTIAGRRELPFIAEHRLRHVGFVDPSGGSQDSFTLAIAHRESDGRAVLDCVRERKPPFSPESVTREFAAVLKSYGLLTVRGDRYAGEWPRERFREHGITYLPASMAKSDLYRELLPLVNAERAELLDIPRLTVQLIGLERRTARGGRDSIDHAPGAHDDVANAAAGALVAAAGKRKYTGPLIW